MMKKKLSGLGSVRLQATIFEGISKSPETYLIFFDNLDRISPSQQAFIETLSQYRCYLCSCKLR